MVSSAVDAVVARIRDMITTGELRPGARLPSEPALAAALGLSRNSVREAVRGLAAARVLDARHGDGTYVTSLRPDLLLDGIGFAAEMMQDDSIPELLEVRRVVEPQAAALAAARITPAGLQRVGACLRLMRGATSHGEFVRLDAEFHDLVNRASGNESLAAILRGVSTSSHRARLWRDILEAGASERTIDEHEQIFAALRAGDRRAAERTAREHVRSTESWFLGVVRDDPGSAGAAARAE